MKQSISNLCRASVAAGVVAAASGAAAAAEARPSAFETEFELGIAVDCALAGRAAEAGATFVAAEKLELAAAPAADWEAAIGDYLDRLLAQPQDAAPADADAAQPEQTDEAEAPTAPAISDDQSAEQFYAEFFTVEADDEAPAAPAGPLTFEDAVFELLEAARGAAQTAAVEVEPADEVFFADEFFDAEPADAAIDSAEPVESTPAEAEPVNAEFFQEAEAEAADLGDAASTRLIGWRAAVKWAGERSTTITSVLESLDRSRVGVPCVDGACHASPADARAGATWHDFQ